MDSLGGKRLGVGIFFRIMGFKAPLISALFLNSYITPFFYLTFTPKYEPVISGHWLWIYSLYASNPF